MANTKSAQKRILVSNKKAMNNRVVKSRTKTAIKKAVQAAAAGDANAKESVLIAISNVDRAVSKGVLHKNTGARRKSQLAKLLK